jgi:hypothetical protein
MSTTSPPPAGTPDVRDKVKVPAMLLMATAGLTGALQMAIVIVNLAAPGWLSVGNMSITILGMNIGLAGGVLGGVGVLIAAFVVYGALCMMRLRSYGMALGASIAIMVPILSPCCLLGLPVGILGILVLRSPGVKAAFTNA